MRPARDSISRRAPSTSRNFGAPHAATMTGHAHDEAHEASNASRAPAYDAEIDDSETGSERRRA